MPLWVRQCNDENYVETFLHSFQWGFLDRVKASPVVASAVLWRLIFGWEGSTEKTPGEYVAPGPVLEVLFLATTPLLREGGEAQKLVAELEQAAAGMGCIAVAVAAVPGQGRNFWKRCGYDVLVSLKGERPEGAPCDEWSNGEDSSDAAPFFGLEEPVSPLGRYLLDHMLLFTDTPLVCKVLK